MGVWWCLPSPKWRRPVRWFLPRSVSFVFLVTGYALDWFNRHSAKSIWDFEGIFCSSRHIPHVRFAGLIHPGILGCAPSAEVLAEWNRREGDLIAANTDASRVVAQPPIAKGVHAGSAGQELANRVAKEGARTIPVRLLPLPTSS